MSSSLVLLDEVHERSVNIDLCVGCIANAVKERRKLFNQGLETMRRAEMRVIEAWIAREKDIYVKHCELQSKNRHSHLEHPYKVSLRSKFSLFFSLCRVRSTLLPHPPLKAILMSATINV
ncbi:hypothetical protein ADUPG1_001948, partial [Aduncisulcus paluster]